MKETKEARFRRVAEARVNKLIRMLRLLGNCFGTNTYAYDDDAVEQIFTELQVELDRARERFAEMGSRDESGSLFRKRRRRTPFHIHTSRFLCRMARGCAPSAMQTRLIQPSIYIFYRMASRMS